MTFDRDALWQWLDAAGVPFRAPLGDLIAEYGTVPSGWTDALRYCPLPGGDALLPHLAQPLAVQVGLRDDLARAPAALVGYIRRSSFACRNQRIGATALRAHFGAGRDTSASNTVSLAWGDAYCGLTATAFPPRLNRSFGRNDRHARVPGSKTECTVTILPDFDLPLTVQELAWLRAWQPDPAFPAIASSAYQGRWRRLPFGCDVPAGFGFVQDDTALIGVSRNQRLQIVPRSQITAVTHDLLTPAKGGGGSWVSVRHAIGPEDDAPTRAMQLLFGGHDAPDHRRIAEALSARLNVPLHTSSEPDC